MSRTLLAALMVVCVGAAGARAESPTARAPGDERVRFVAYDANNVVPIAARMGVSTMIQFAEGEKVETVAAGDTASWSIVPTKRGDIVFVKPLKAGAATNLSLVTDKRVYMLSLRAGDAGRGGMYAVKFRYPGEERNKALLAQAQELAAKPNLRRAAERGVFRNYYSRGSDAYRPSEAFDDGLKTFLKFSGDVPSFFLVQPDGTETLLNYRREGEFVVIDKIASQITLRKGTEWTCIYRMPEAPGAGE